MSIRFEFIKHGKFNFLEDNNTRVLFERVLSGDELPSQNIK